MAAGPSSELEHLYSLGAARIARFSAPWTLDDAVVRETLARSVASWGGLERGESVEDYLEALRIEDLALAIACRAGVAIAWEAFIEKYRPILYASARAICREDTAARDLADSMWAELYGVDAKGAQHRSLLDYFHGRSSLATWLRAILAQRHVDGIRGARRFEPLEDHDARSSDEAADPAEPGHLRMMELFASVLVAAIAALESKDRLRLAYYYREELTLREITRAMGEHESTVSRNLDRTRRELRKQVEHALRRTHRMSTEQIRFCFEHAASDAPFRFGAEVAAQKKEGTSF